MEGNSLRILLIGNGGREHALAWKLCQSPRVEKLYIAPGNGGTGNIPKAENIPYLNPDKHLDLLVFARESRVNLVVVGPEAPLVAGIEEVFRSAGIRCFGPIKAAARMEGSKTFAKDFMARHNIPTARYQNFSDYAEARQHLEEVKYDIVLKATGLAAGKGVIIPCSKQEAQAALKPMMVEKQFGSAGNEVVIEEYLVGQELSFLSFVDGYTVKSLVPAQDHKQVFENDQGPNTGGMGCYAPAPIAEDKLIKEVHQTILQPTIDGLRKERMPFKGLLFTGIMVTKDGPKVLEYNTRFGDPETQTLLPLMDGDLAEVLIACTDGYLDTIDVRCKPGSSSVTVVAAAAGYPGSYNKGETITIDTTPSEAEGTYIFHAGTSIASGALTTSGGRVIAATAIASDLKTALSKAYATISTFHFQGMHYRKDIAHRALSTTPTFTESDKNLTYASSGVSIDAGNALVRKISSLVASTKRPGANPTLDSFGGQFDPVAAGHERSPVLISGMDGVGTKLRIAQRMHKHDTIGIDLVAMCANDVAACGAEVWWMMDTVSANKLDVGVAASVVEGVAEGCRRARCALLGGETAEMGQLIQEGEYDIVGSCTGAVVRGGGVLPKKREMREGDVLLGLASSGCHSNGFSLIQKIVERAGLGYGDHAPWDSSMTVGESLLTPTKIYVGPLLRVFQHGLVKGAAHITGGGIPENVPRVLPEHLTAEVEAKAWSLPSVFRWLMNAGNVERGEMARVFNMGIGMVLVVAEENVGFASRILEERGEKVVRIGALVERGERGGRCVIRDMEVWE
ncbi:MAG: hypothetical protein LQ338_004674 [Usnochroma carphineum]|nr:MAG: hypothetical protein LQ338_004674 [Usnochroma carphineum]